MHRLGSEKELKNSGRFMPFVHHSPYAHSAMRKNKAFLRHRSKKNCWVSKAMAKARISNSNDGRAAVAFVDLKNFVLTEGGATFE
uniref:Uncharacterized protein n=1 Tax=Panagrolaimus sp. ES5 TaxID=591445 RepID=A0AC34GQ59_9BILA